MRMCLCVIVGKRRSSPSTHCCINWTDDFLCKECVHVCIFITYIGKIVPLSSGESNTEEMAGLCWRFGAVVFV